MKIGIIYNVQHESLRIAMAALLPDAQIVSIDPAALPKDEALRGRITAELAGSNHIVAASAAMAHDVLHASPQGPSGRAVHILPPLHFAGFHPDSIHLRLDRAVLRGPTGFSHSRIAVCAYLAGLPPAEAAALYNRLSFARLGYLAAFAEQQTLLLDPYSHYGIDLRPDFEAWIARGCFMHDAGHPRMRVMLDMARAACAMAGLQPGPAPDEAALPDPLASLAIHPVFPDIAAAIGIAPSGAFRGPQLPGAQTRVLGTEAFVKASHEAYARLPLAVLRQADGVAAAMAALDLREAPRKRPPPREPASNTTAFLTWHGAVLTIEAASAMLMQSDIAPADPDCVDLLAEWPERLPAAPVQSAMLGGVTIAPAERTGAVSFSRGGAFLCAEPRNHAVRFDRTQAADWESFLPIPIADLANLRALAEGNWIVEEDKRRLPASLMHTLPGFKCAIGDLVLDLRHERPVKLERPGGAVFRVTAGGKTITLAQDRSKAGKNERLLLPARPLRQPTEAFRREEFLALKQARLRLQAAPELLHPPITACNAGRDWLHATYFDHAGPAPQQPGAGRHTLHATLLRDRGQLLMLGRGLEGILLGEDGVTSHAACLHGQAHDRPYLRQAGPVPLLNREATANAPVIEGPACVFYNPGVQDYYHFLIEGLLALHVMAPYLPPATRLVLPGTLTGWRHGETPFDHASLLATLGFGQLPTIELHEEFASLQDAIWLEDDTIQHMPAAMLQSFRTRAHALHPPSGPRRRLFIKPTGSCKIANQPAIEALLRPHGFDVITLETMPVQAHIGLFATADFVVAAHGAGLANLLFCQPGTRVLELMPDREFRPRYWLMAEKLGLNYGVLPCPASGAGGNLKADIGRFRALFRMLRAMEV